MPDKQLNKQLDKQGLETVQFNASQQLETEDDAENDAEAIRDSFIRDGLNFDDFVKNIADICSNKKTVTNSEPTAQDLSNESLPVNEKRSGNAIRDIVDGIYHLNKIRGDEFQGGGVVNETTIVKYQNLIIKKMDGIGIFAVDFTRSVSNFTADTAKLLEESIKIGKCSRIRNLFGSNDEIVIQQVFLVFADQNKKRKKVLFYDRNG